MRRFILVLSFALAATGATAQTKPTSTMQLDSDHASITAGVGGSKSRFAVAAGALEYDSARPEHSTIAVSLDTTSLADQEARTAFNADRFPELRITSTGVGKKNGKAEALATDVTIHDITRRWCSGYLAVGNCRDGQFTCRSHNPQRRFSFGRQKP